MQKPGNELRNLNISQVVVHCPVIMILCPIDSHPMPYVDTFGDKGNILVNSFIYSLVAVAAITIVASVVLGGIDLSSADVFQLKDSVRL